MTPPPHVDDWEELAQFAAREHASRVATYPATIAKGSITQPEADEDIAAWAAIAWSWADGLRRLRGAAAPTPAPAVDRHDRIMAIRAAIRRQLRRVSALPEPIDQADPIAIRLAGLTALQWHETNPFTFLWCVETTLLGRAQAAERIDAAEHAAA